MMELSKISFAQNAGRHFAGKRGFSEQKVASGLRDIWWYKSGPMYWQQDNYNTTSLKRQTEQTKEMEMID